MLDLYHYWTDYRLLRQKTDKCVHKSYVLIMDLMENKLVRLNPQIIVINICFCIILVVLIGCYQNLAPVEIGKGSIYSSKTKVPKPTKKPSITQMHERNVADTQNIL